MRGNRGVCPTSRGEKEGGSRRLHLEKTSWSGAVCLFCDMNWCYICECILHTIFIEIPLRVLV